MRTESKTYEITGNQFPFGVLSASSESAKIFVKKRYSYRSEEEYDELMKKVEKLKTISHKNTINLRSICEGSKYVDTFYQYIPISLEDFFCEGNPQTVKEMHKQFIELAIYLAKNFIITTFSPSRCGVLINQSRTLLKYYIPLNEITITDNRNLLERSVQLLNVQSMHYLDTLLTQSLSSSLNESFSQRTFKNRIKLFPSKETKPRRDSQPSIYQRKFSNNPTKESQMRKLSSLSRELTEISKMHNRRGQSTRISGDSFKTMHSIQSLKSGPQVTEKSKMVACKSQEILKRCLSKNAIENAPLIDGIISRSRKALGNLQNLREMMSTYKSVFNTLIKMHKQY